jgi:pseudaminic acid synthase
MMHEIKIKDRLIGAAHKPFIVAEMSGNHNQSLDRALAIVDAAAAAGADAIKLQTYTADTITMKGVHTIMEEDSLWHGKELYDLYKEAYTPWEWHEKIIRHAESKNMICFSSPFDETAVDLLESLNTPAYKIASFENTHHPLLIKVAKTGKPVIMSTGVSNVSDIDESIRILRQNGCKELVILKCTSTYPALPVNTNLLTIPHMRDLYRCPIGLSDHTMGIGVSVAAVALQAVLIEKHFTLSRAEGGVDSAFSMEPEELKNLVIETERAWQALGHIQYGIQKAEEENVYYKRSIYIAKDIEAGQKFNEENIRVIRPGDGLAPKHYTAVLGKTAQRFYKQGTPLKWEDIL